MPHRVDTAAKAIQARALTKRAANQSCQPRRMAPQRTWKVPFVALAEIWGASFLFIKVGVETLVPLQVAFARCAIGAAVLLA